MTRLAAILLLPLLLGAGYYSPEQQRHLATFWPKSVKMPAGLRFYSISRASQVLDMRTNGTAYYGLHSWAYDGYGTNPNRIAPWAVPGGLERVPRERWFSVFGVSIPASGKVSVWTHTWPDKMQQVAWEFPVGTIFADMLCATDGQRAWPFEVRLREKINGRGTDGDGWDSRVLVRNRDVLPTGFTGPDRKCVECHRFAGGRFGRGAVLRGSDTVFSWSPFTADSVSYDGAEKRLEVDESMLQGWAEE